MRLFSSLLLAAGCAASLAACSPKLVPLTSDMASAALPAGTPYALLHFYRPGKMTGFLIGYDVHVGDSVGYRARNGSQGAVRRHVPGPVTVWAKTEAREEIVLDVQPGREYYVRCSIGMGALVGRPHLQQVSVVQGRKESGAIAGATP
ncbi:hypothetical protein [Hymenobacter glaciei]|uniref:hypothetical protein n=1 Tax=Hymenobacter glaciei TaxID=877209 RepID=UPI0031EF1070